MSSANDNPAAQLLSAYAAAIYAKDVEAFLALYDDNVCIFDMWGTAWAYRGLTGWRAMAQEWFGKMGDELVLVETDHVQFKLTPALSFVSAFVKYTAVSSAGKSLRSLQNRLTWMVEPKSDGWKITHEHTSAPADHNTLKISLGVK